MASWISKASTASLKRLCRNLILAIDQYNPIEMAPDRESCDASESGRSAGLILPFSSDAPRNAKTKDAPVCTEFSFPRGDRSRDDQKDRGHHSRCRRPLPNLCESPPHRVISLHRKVECGFFNSHSLNHRLKEFRSSRRLFGSYCLVGVSKRLRTVADIFFLLELSGCAS